MMLLDIPVPTWRDILDILFLTIVAYGSSSVWLFRGPFIRWSDSGVYF